MRPESVAIDYTDRVDHPVVKPIDAEAVYLNPRVGLCRWDAPVSAVLDMLRWHKGACFVAGVGVIGAGKVTLEQAAHHVSSGESIAQVPSVGPPHPRPARRPAHRALTSRPRSERIRMNALRHRVDPCNAATC